MKFIVTKVSDWKYKRVVEINTLEELLEMRKQYGRIIILENYINDKEYPDIKLEIEIYDGYRE